MISRYERANLLQNFIPGNVFVLEIRRKLYTRKVSGVSRNGPLGDRYKGEDGGGEGGGVVTR